MKRALAFAFVVVAACGRTAPSARDPEPTVKVDVGEKSIPTVDAGVSSADMGHKVDIGEKSIPTVDAGGVSNAGMGHMIKERYYVEAGAPDPLACKADADCLGDTVTDSTGCCVVSPKPWPQTWAWHTWLSKRRQGYLGACNMACPELPGPEQQEACRFAVHCTSGNCTNTCR